MKDIEIQIEMRVEFDKHKVKQSFIFNNKDKNTKYLFDNRYLLSNMFTNLMREKNIVSEDYQFANEEDLKDRVILNFIIVNREGNPLDNFSAWFTLADVIPDCPGCEFCIYKKPTDNLFFQCLKKEKTMSKDIKKCVNFRQKDLKIIT